MKKKILISGTGRSGTTFLMLIFSLLGLDTGYHKGANFEKMLFPNCNSGLEKTWKAPHQIIKSPAFMVQLDKILKKRQIEYFIIPVRDYEHSANSRAKNGTRECGGLWNATNANEQVKFYHKIMAEYILKMVRHNIPTLFLDFDRMVDDVNYLYKKLSPILDENSVTQDQFNLAYKKASENQRKTKLPDDFGQHPSNADNFGVLTPDQVGELKDDETDEDHNLTNIKSTPAEIGEKLPKFLFDVEFLKQIVENEETRKILDSLHAQYQKLCNKVIEPLVEATIDNSEKELIEEQPPRVVKEYTKTKEDAVTSDPSSTFKSCSPTVFIEEIITTKARSNSTPERIMIENNQEHVEELRITRRRSDS